jgi:hypothetical protein
MSAQGVTVGRRGIVHLPLFPIVAALAAVVVAIIVLSIPTSGTRSEQVTRVGDLTRFANSSAAVREQGGSLPIARPLDTSGIESASMWTPAQAEAYQAQLRYVMGLYEGSSAAIREQGAVAYHAAGRAHEVNVTAVPSTTSAIVGLENPGAYLGEVAATAYATGLENPGAYGAGSSEPGFRPHGAFGG